MSAKDVRKYIYPLTFKEMVQKGVLNRDYSSNWGLEFASSSKTRREKKKFMESSRPWFVIQHISTLSDWIKERAMIHQEDQRTG